MCSAQEITSSLDSFIIDKDMPYWVITLDDGTTVYEDDNRPGLSEQSAWKRLKRHCEEHARSIHSVRLVFRSNNILIDTRDWDGVFFIKSLLGQIRLNKSGKPMPIRRFPNRQYYNIGRLSDGILTVSKYELPTIQYRTTEERTVGQIETELIIYNARL